MIKVIQTNGVRQPTFFCDWCGKRIVDDPGATIHWLAKQTSGLGTQDTLYYAHTHCSSAADEHPTASHRWHIAPLSQFITFIEAATGEPLLAEA